MCPKTQLIAHDKEVYDMTFSSGAHNFATVGADGSVRLFDLRSVSATSSFAFSTCLGLCMFIL